MTGSIIRMALMYLRQVRGRRRARGRGARPAAPAAQARRRPPERVQRHRFQNCRAAVAFLNAGNEMGRANPQFSPRVARPTITAAPGGGFTASADVAWTYNAARSTTALTRPEWPNMTDADRAAVQRFLDALRVHEDGHHEVARDYAPGAGTTVTAHGATLQQARHNLQQALNEHRREVRRELRARGDEYDRITEHGRNQQARGGQNVRLNCP